MKYLIREKKLEDCEEWINVNIASWNENLKGIVSDRLLEKISSNKEARIKTERENLWNKMTGTYLMSLIKRIYIYMDLMILSLTRNIWTNK